jgi:hypothetical protein
MVLHSILMVVISFYQNSSFWGNVVLLHVRTMLRKIFKLKKIHYVQERSIKFTMKSTVVGFVEVVQMEVESNLLPEGPHSLAHIYGDEAIVSEDLKVVNMSI